jgi:hypothetical protein
MSPTRPPFPQTISVQRPPADDPARWRSAPEVPRGGSGQVEASGAEDRVRPLGKPLLALPAIAAIVLMPWTVGLATRLAHRAVAYHWNVAWAGLDVAIAIGLALTSWWGYRRDARAALSATATTTLMCADAWFDLCTSAPGHPFAYAAAEATAELMVAVVCLAIGLLTRRDRDGRIPADLLASGNGGRDARRVAGGAGPRPGAGESGGASAPRTP